MTHNGYRSFAIPVCSACSGKMQKDDRGSWFCLSCADEWLHEFVHSKGRGHSLGGVSLPAGVQDHRRDGATFRDLLPNRVMRRRMAKR